MLKRIPITLAAASVAIGIAVAASDKTPTTQAFTAELITALSNAGTDVAFARCQDEIYGRYQYEYTSEGERLLDQVTVCTNYTNMTDRAAVWSVLAHEATHVAQACNDVGVTGLSAKALEAQLSEGYDYQEIANYYSKEDLPAEREAYAMEFAPKQAVVDLVNAACEVTDG